jgi:hypothetical protein
MLASDKQSYEASIKMYKKFYNICFKSKYYKSGVNLLTFKAFYEKVAVSQQFFHLIKEIRKQTH